MKEVKSCYCEWCDTRNRIERTPRIQRLLFKKQPKFMQIFFEIRKLDYYFEFDVPVYEKHDSTTLHYVFQNPRKAIELTLLIAEHITSLLDERSPQNNPLLTSDGYADIESIFNSATEHGSVNVKTDDNPKAVENPNSNRTPGKVVKRKISAKVPEKSRRLLYILSLMAGYTGSTKTYDLLKDIENLEKEISKIEKRERRTHTQDIRILCDCGLIRKDKGSHYSITEKGREDVNRFKSDDQKKNSSEPTNLDWFTKKWHNNESDEGVGRK
jgi:predicted transcriptional regulator